jgi:2-C-methyl-D-erythritol 4-phosphate cytidylyltransferase
MRAGGSEPKQFACIGGQPVLAHALRALLAEPRIAIAFVVLSPEDRRFAGAWRWAEFGDRVAPLYCGGATRAMSVANGLAAVANIVELDDWILVHDAARPCLQPGDVRRLVDAVWDDEVGGLLASPLADTLKLSDAGAPGGARAVQRIERTVERANLWCAMTPQMFRMGRLLRALESARAAGVEITDEASAMERMGWRARLVQGARSNIKITFAEDLELAARLLAGAGESAGTP